MTLLFERDCLTFYCHLLQHILVHREVKTREMAAWGHAKAQSNIDATALIDANPPSAVPRATGNYVVDKSVIAGNNDIWRSSLMCTAHPSWTAFPEEGTLVVHAQLYGESLWGSTVKINAKLPSGDLEAYFLKVRCSNSVFKGGETLLACR